MSYFNRTYEEHLDYAKRISEIMKMYDKEDYCDLHNMYLIDFYKADDVYIAIAALLDVYNAIRNGNKPTFADLDHETYMEDAYDEIDFDDWEEYMDMNYEIECTRVVVRSRKDIQKKVAELVDDSVENVKRLFESYERELIVYGLVNRIEYMLQARKGE